MSKLHAVLIFWFAVYFLFEILAFVFGMPSHLSPSNLAINSIWIQVFISNVPLQISLALISFLLVNYNEPKLSRIGEYCGYLAIASLLGHIVIALV